MRIENSSKIKTGVFHFEFCKLYNRKLFDTKAMITVEHNPIIGVLSSDNKTFSDICFSIRYVWYLHYTNIFHIGKL